jgi:hypothetical protein
MIRKICWLSLMFLLVSSAAYAGFVNGGFEEGTFNGWDRNGGEYRDYPNSYYHWIGDPGKSAIVSPGADPIVGIPMVAVGNYAARVNNSDWNYHFSTVSQTVVWTEPNIYFGWAAVLEDPGHIDEPHFRATLTDNTTQTTLYNMYFSYSTMPNMHQNGNWRYTDWNMVNMDTSAVNGHSLTLELLASDCGYGGHGGYAYLDGIGSTAPPLPDVPLPPSVLLLGSGLVGLGGFRFWRNRS